MQRLAYYSLLIVVWFTSEIIQGQEPKPKYASKLHELFNKLEDEFQAKIKRLPQDDKYDKAVQKLETALVLQQIDLIKQHSQDRVASELLLRFVNYEWTSPNVSDIALDVLSKSFRDAPDAGLIAWELRTASDKPKALQFIQSVHGHHSRRDARAYAAYAEAYRLNSQGRLMGIPERDAIKLLEEAEKKLQRVVEEYGDVKGSDEIEPHTGRSLKEVISDDLYQVRHLSPGRKTPDFAGVTLDSKTIKLSEYAGKIVVLEFWESEGPRWSVQESQEIVAELFGKPVSLITINRDKKTDPARTAAKELKLSCPVICDAPEFKISHDYRAEFTPTSMILDHTGAIRVAEGNEKKKDLILRLLRSTPAVKK